jgi:hypothetical protein
MKCSCCVQFLEGFALGSAVVDAGIGNIKAYMMALFYSLSTPLGIAIGEAPPSRPVPCKYKSTVHLQHFPQMPARHKAALY